MLAKILSPKVKKFLAIAAVFILGVLVGANWSSIISQLSGSGGPVYSYQFSGQGGGTVGPFALQDGLVLITIKNQAGANSYLGAEIFHDEDKDKQRGDGDRWWGQLINVGYQDAEAFDGTIPIKVTAGDYFIDISGTKWQITVEQPSLLTKQAGAFTVFAGQGPQVSGKFYLPAGKHDFKAYHQGGGNFIVYLIDENGNFSRRLVNEIGNFDGQFTTEIVLPGNYLFHVYGMGDWQVERLD